MKILLLGYGKMGHMIEKYAIDYGHEVLATVDPFQKDASHKIENGDTEALIRIVKEIGPDGIIDFSSPASIMENIKALLPLGIPLVVGTTGWKDKEEEVRELAAKVGGIIMTSANFSIGVNMFYKIITEAVKILSDYSEYDISTWEAHHSQKLDSPSGTALEIAKRIIDNNPVKDTMVFDAFHNKPEANQLHVSSTRCGNIPGTHKVFFDSPADTIELTHTARNREGFASGAVHALENLVNGIKTGALTKGKLYGMEDLF